MLDRPFLKIYKYDILNDYNVHVLTTDTCYTVIMLFVCWHSPLYRVCFVGYGMQLVR